MSGLITAALYLINKYAETNHRGYITGLANIFSVLGIFMTAVLGGLLFDNLTKTAPFLMFAAFVFLGLMLMCASFIFNKNEIAKLKGKFHKL